MADMTQAIRVDLPPDLDVAAMVTATANGPGDPTMRRADDGIYRSFLLPSGAATAKFDQPSPTTAEVTLWGPGARDLTKRVPGLLGLDDDVDDFGPSGHPAVYDMARRAPTVRLGASGDVWGALLAGVLGQRVIGKEAQLSFRRLVNRFGSATPSTARAGCPQEIHRVVPLAPHRVVVVPLADGPPAWRPHRRGGEMAAFEVTLSDRTELVDDVDGYDLEGPLTTFFRSDRGRASLDAWSVRVASFRSTDVRAVRRLDPAIDDRVPRLVLGAAG